MTIIHERFVRGMEIKVFIETILVLFFTSFASFYLISQPEFGWKNSIYPSIFGSIFVVGIYIMFIICSKQLKKRKRIWCLIDDSVGFHDFYSEYRVVGFEEGMFIIEEKQG